MADLIDRISGDSTDMDPPRPTINLHHFIGVMRLYAIGVLSRAQVVADLDLQGDELTQANAMADAIDGEAGALAKVVRVLRFEAVMESVQSRFDTRYHGQAGGTIDNKPLIQSDAGF